MGNKPEESMKIINGIGFRLADEGDLLILGENFANCPDDCSLDDKTVFPYNEYLKGMCSNKEKDKETKEEDVDCGGLCPRNCFCTDHGECTNVCEDGDIVTNVEQCACDFETGKCVNSNDCDEDSDCNIVRNDCCGNKILAINKKYNEPWYGSLDSKCESISCTKSYEYKKGTKCVDNKCVITDEINVKEDVSQEELVKELVEEEPVQEEITPKNYNIYSDYDNEECVVYVGENESLEYYDICGDDCENTLSSCNKKFEKKSFIQKIFSWFTNLF